MNEWIALKSQIVDWVGLDRDALHILAGLVGLFVVAALARRPIAGPLPWLALLVAELLNEAVSGLADGRIERWELDGSAHDLWVVMAAPTALMLIARYASHWLIGPAAVQRRALLIEFGSDRPEPVDADYEEFEEDESGAWRPR